MRVRPRLALALVVVVVAGAAAVWALPEIVRRVAIAQIHAVTERPVQIEAVTLNPFTGRVAVRGFRLGERGEAAPFADIGRLDARLRPLALLRGHLWLRELVVTGSTVRLVRLPSGDFNISDLIEGPASPGGPPAVTVDRFALSGGTVSLEDRALPETRTWTSEQIEIEARNVSTQRDDGTAVARSVTAGAPSSLEITELRLYPIHLRATASMEGLDLTPLRLYAPPDAPMVVERGRGSASIRVVLDAREGLHADATARIEDVRLVPPDGGPPLGTVPALGAEVVGFWFRDGDLRLGRLTVDGTMAVRDPTAARTHRLVTSRVRASVADFTWPATTPGRVEVVTGIPGGGSLTVLGTVRQPPENTQLEVRLANLDLAPWARMLPVSGRVTGVAEANLRMNEPLAPGVPARVQGAIALNRPALSDGRREVLGARRVEANGLELHWPTRLVVKRVLVTEPAGIVERDQAGDISLTSLLSSPAPRAAGPAPAPSSSPPPLRIDVAEVVVKEGRLTWRDAAVSPAATLAVSAIEASVAGIGWPLQQPLGVRLALRPPGGGHLQVSGRLGLDPMTADLRVVSRDAELAPYQPYVPTRARFSGAADADLVVVVPSLAERRATVRGTAALSRVDVRDGERTVARVERAAASGVQLDWPGRLTINQVALVRPWLLVERDRQGGLPLRSLLTPESRGSGAATAPSAASDDGEPLVVSITRIAADDGGARIVDNAVAPPFAIDLQPVTLRVDGFSTRPGTPPVRVDLQTRVAASAELGVRGTVGIVGAPLRIDLSGELREFAVPRTNPYLAQHVGWQTREGRLTTSLQCRIEGDALSARTDVRLSRLQLVRAASHDEAQTRIGLPLGLITTLMKDQRGDITLSFPVGGRLNDPRFDFRDAIWGAIRTVAINAITLPVSWIGRVRFTPDSRIEQIQVDPLPFEPGTPTLTSAGATRVGRLVAFLDQLPSVALTLTPTVSSRDVDELRRRSVEADLERVARQSRLSREDAAARLFAQQVPDRPVPADPEAIVAALTERVTVPPERLAELATQRLQTVRAAVTRAGVDAARLTESEPRPRESAESQVEIEVREPDAGRPSKIRETLRKLGVPLPGGDADK
jgi:hypothetical protein